MFIYIGDQHYNNQSYTQPLLSHLCQRFAAAGPAAAAREADPWPFAAPATSKVAMRHANEQSAQLHKLHGYQWQQQHQQRRYASQWKFNA